MSMRYWRPPTFNDKLFSDGKTETYREIQKLIKQQWEFFGTERRIRRIMYGDKEYRKFLDEKYGIDVLGR